MKKQYIFVAVAVMIAMLTACSNQSVNEAADVSITKPTSFLAGNTESSTALESVTAVESTTEWYEPTTQMSIEAETTEKATTTTKHTTAKTNPTTSKPTTTKASTTKRVTTTQKHTTTKQVITTQRITTTKAEPTPKKVTTTKATTIEKAFDVNYWVSYAKSYAKSKGLNLNSEATDCWDNPINANPNCKYLERDIKDRLGRYANDDDITDVWVWAEKTGSNSYQIYIGYA